MPLPYVAAGRGGKGTFVPASPHRAFVPTTPSLCLNKKLYRVLFRLVLLLFEKMAHFNVIIKQNLGAVPSKKKQLKYRLSSADDLVDNLLD